MRQFSKWILLVIFILHIGYAKEPVRGKNGMVVSASPWATKVGVQILKKGGNAIDAAVAVGFAMAVTHPAAGNLGGGGFLVFHNSDGKNFTIDFRENAPEKATKDMFLDNDGNYVLSNSTTGGKSVGIPGTVDGLISAHDKWGKLNFKEIIQPAIDLAEQGFEIGYRLADNINYYHEKFLEYPSSKKIFTNAGKKLKDDFFLVQKDLSKTLTKIRDEGRKGFYEGDIAKLIVDQVNKVGGIFTLQDLKNYNAKLRKPVSKIIKDVEVISMAPPSSGGIALIQTLETLLNEDIQKSDFGSSKYYHYLVETLRQVYSDRSEHLGDPDFYKVPVDDLLSDNYSRKVKNGIAYRANSSREVKPNRFQYFESDQTTHYSVADKEGNVVSITYTLNSGFGNKCVVEGAGFLLNNEMDDFSAKPGIPNQFGLVGNEANAVAPGKRMLSSMTPTIILKNNKPFLALGGRGGSKIITGTIQVVLNVLLFDMNIQDAVDAPRIHHQWLPDRIDYEEYAINNDVKTSLHKRGHIIGEIKKIANIEAILIDEDGYFWGATDPRGFGLAEGY